MSKITKFVDMMMNFPNRFRVDGVQKTIVEDWGITQQGTKNKAEYFNEIQKQITYDCLSNRIIDGSKEVYKLDLEGYVEFGEYNLKTRVFFQTANTTTNCYIRLYSEDGATFIEYPIRYYNKNLILTPPAIGTLAQKKFINFKVIDVSGIKYAVIDFSVMDITSTTDGITVANGKDLTLNVINNLTTSSATKPLSANAGKYLNENKWEMKGNYISTAIDADTMFENGEFNLRIGSQTNPPPWVGGSNFFISSRFTARNSSGYGHQIAYGYGSMPISFRTYNGETQTWTNWKILQTDESCPTPIGGILAMADNTSPADKYPGTTWAIQADTKFTMAGNQSTVNATGGSNSKTIAVGNLPAFSVTRGTMEITGDFTQQSDYGFKGPYSGAFYQGTSLANGDEGSSSAGPSYKVAFQASRNWTGASSSVGSGTELDVTNAYQKFVYWKRTA